MSLPKFTCPVCGYSETPWQKEDHALRHDIWMIRGKHKIDKLVESLFKEHPDIKREKSDAEIR